MTSRYKLTLPSQTSESESTVLQQPPARGITTARMSGQTTSDKDESTRFGVPYSLNLGQQQEGTSGHAASTVVEGSTESSYNHPILPHPGLRPTNRHPHHLDSPSESSPSGSSALFAWPFWVLPSSNSQSNTASKESSIVEDDANFTSHLPAPGRHEPDYGHFSNLAQNPREDMDSLPFERYLPFDRTPLPLHPQYPDLPTQTQSSSLHGQFDHPTQLAQPSGSFSTAGHFPPDSSPRWSSHVVQNVQSFYPTHTEMISSAARPLYENPGAIPTSPTYPPFLYSDMPPPLPTYAPYGVESSTSVSYKPIPVRRSEYLHPLPSYRGDDANSIPHQNQKVTSIANTATEAKPSDYCEQVLAAVKNRERLGGNIAAGLTIGKKFKKTTTTTTTTSTSGNSEQSSYAEPHAGVTSLPISPTDQLKVELLEEQHRTLQGLSPNVRTAIEYPVICISCHTPLAKLTLRGKVSELLLPIRSKYACRACLPIDDPPGSISGSVPSETLERSDTSKSPPGTMPPIDTIGGTEESSYADTLSAAVDRVQGQMMVFHDERPAPSRCRAIGTPAKRRRAEEEFLTCDVCTRHIGSGGLFIANSDTLVSVGVETLCQICSLRYKRCTDCGGGGGPRLGVGRWRCKELFPTGRKTCQLSHMRLGSLGDMSYDVRSVDQIPDSEIHNLVEIMRDLYHTTVLSIFALPDMLESSTPIARNFEEVQKIALDSWTLFEPMLLQKFSHQSQTKRYVGLRWCRPSSRKKVRASSDDKNASKGQEVEDEKPGSLQATSRSRSATKSLEIVKDGRTLTGFIIADAELPFGTIFLPLILPTGTGDSYDATNRLLRDLVTCIKNDVREVNSGRLVQGLPEYPPPTHSWTALMYKRESRVMNRMEGRRGFMPLSEYLTKYPEANPAWFLISLSFEVMKGWCVLARQVGDIDDWFSPRTTDGKSRPARKSRKESELLE